MRKFVKLISVVTAFMVVSAVFAGCTGKQQETPKTSAATQPAAPAGPKVDKNAKVRIFAPDNAGVKGYEPGASENDNQFLKAIKDKTGYRNLEWSVYNAGGANAQDKLNLFFASGEQIDMVLWSSPDMFKYFQTQGVLQAVDDSLKQAGAAIVKEVQDAAWSSVTIGGKKYGIPMPFYQIFNNIDLGAGLLARQDWMDKLSLKAPRNTDELYSFLKTMKDKDPGGKGIIPYVAPAGNKGDPLEGLAPITAPFGISVPYIVKEGKIVSTEDLYLKDALDFLARLYKEGLLDKEYLFNKTAQVNEKVGSGKAAAVFANYFDVKSHLAAVAKIDPGAKMEFLPLIEGKNGLKGYSKPSPIQYVNFIPKTAKYPMEVVDLMNLYMSDKELQMFVNFGKEGTHYQKKDGVLTPIQPAYDAIIYKILFRMWNNAEIWLPNAIMAGYESGMKSYTAAGAQNIVFNIDHYKPKMEVETSKAKTLSDLKNEYVAKIINGSLPVSAVDEYLKKADAAGRQEVMKAIQEWYDKDGKAIYEQLNKK